MSGVVAISKRRSMSQPMSTIKGSLNLIECTQGLVKKDANESHCTPRLRAKFCHARWCRRLSTLSTADVRTASTKERVQGMSLGRDDGASRPRNRATSIAQRNKSIRACRARIPNLGPTSFEVSHLRNIPYARMQLRILGGKSRYSVSWPSSEIKCEGSTCRTCECIV